MKPATLEQTMGQLGWALILGFFFQLRIDDRSVLLPAFGVAAVVLLGRMDRSPAFHRSRWFIAARVGAVIVTVAAAVALVPAIEPGVPSALAMVAAAAGVAAYAGALRDWSVAQGWEPPAAKARSAQAWLFAAAGAMVVALAVFVLIADPAPMPADPSYSPSGLLGRPFEGWAPGVAILGLLVVWAVGLLRLRGASQLIRHSLRAQPDAELVTA